MGNVGPTTDRRLPWFIGQCRKRGLAMTHQRLAIYATLAGTDRHPTAEIIYRQIQDRYPTISLATVYKTLETLERKGLISKHTFFHEAAQYDANLAPHHHRVCMKCRRVEDFYDRLIDRLPSTAHRRGGFEVSRCQLQLIGLCPRCRRARRRKRQSA